MATVGPSPGVHGGVSPAVPCRATPPTIDRLEREEPCADALDADPRAQRRRPPRAHRSGPASRQRIDGSESISQSMTLISLPRQ